MPSMASQLKVPRIATVSMPNFMYLLIVTQLLTDNCLSQ
jgi:hypothetical protein